MAIISILTSYYQQYDADFALKVPGQGYGGWKKALIKIDTSHTAFVLMHAWDTGTQKEFAGWHRAVEYFSRAESICQKVLPPLIKSIRASDMELFHVVRQGTYYENYPGFKKPTKIAVSDSDSIGQITDDPIYKNLKKFRYDRVFPGKHNISDINKGFARLDFAPQTYPTDKEGIAEDSKQLASLCKDHGINHLIYLGFAINWCILMSPGGMLDMDRYGVICSTIPQAVTAVENKETASTETNKAIALWRVSLAFGFIFELDDIIEMLGKTS